MFSVIICTYNRSDYIEKVLNGFAAQDFPFSGFELVVVNNNSSDNTEELVLAFQAANPTLQMRYFVESQQGLSYARNRGIAESRGNILIFMDDDAVPRSGYLTEMDKFFQEYPDTLAVGGRIYPVFESKRPGWMSPLLLSLTSSIDLGDKVRPFKNGLFPIGANMAFRKEVFEMYGTFNVLLGRRGDKLEGAEEKDIFFKIYKNKGKVYYVPSAIVDHFVPDKRLTFSFFKKQAKGIGYSERVRALSISKKEYAKSIIKELFKWGATILLFFFYLFTFRPKMGWRLVLFRWYISSKLIG